MILYSSNNNLALILSLIGVAIVIIAVLVFFGLLHLGVIDFIKEDENITDASIRIQGKIINITDSVKKSLIIVNLPLLNQIKLLLFHYVDILLIQIINLYENYLYIL